MGYTNVDPLLVLSGIYGIFHINSCIKSPKTRLGTSKKLQSRLLASNPDFVSFCSHLETVDAQSNSGWATRAPPLAACHTARTMPQRARVGTNESVPTNQGGRKRPENGKSRLIKVGLKEALSKHSKGKEDEPPKTPCFPTYPDKKGTTKTENRALCRARQRFDGGGPRTNPRPRPARAQF